MRKLISYKTWVSVLFSGLVSVAVLSTPAFADSSRSEIIKIHELIRDWQTVEARKQLDPLIKKDSAAIDLRFANGRLLFFEGNYRASLEVLNALLNDLGSQSPPALHRLKTDVENTWNALKPLDEFSTPDGRFLIRYAKKDKALLPYLVDVLAATDAVLTADFKYRPKGRVLVEIYPDIKYLAAVSPLTEEDIETSGTIALCKYNRLMFTSPRALVRGYGWRDTVAHEFVHYYITKMSANTVPIWLHEGIAKFQESRWRTEPGAHLDPPQEDLLARSLAADKLITFQQMHPSMAKLPSQEAAGLAFAEVHTVIHHLHTRKAYAGLIDLMMALKQGLDMDKSLLRVYGVTLSGLWTEWVTAMKKRGLKTYPGLVQQKLEFKRPGDGDKKDDEFEINYGSIEKKRVRDLTHLGELLRGRKRPKAALVEYRKAITLGGEGNPVLQNGAAEALIELGQFGEVAKLLGVVRSYYPGFLRTHLNLGKAFINRGQKQKAIEAFETAIGINPFHPLPHIALQKLYTETGNTKLAEREEKTLELIR